MRDRRQRLAVHYFERLAGLEDIDLPTVRVPYEDHAWHLFVLIVRPTAKVGGNRLIEILTERGVGTSVPYKPLHRLSYYRDHYPLSPADFPEAERIWAGCLALPLYPSLTEEDQDYLCDILIEHLG